MTPELRGGEADAERVVHQLAHPPDLLDERVVEALDLERAALEQGSPYLRTSRSAASRRARVSGSSCA